MLFIINVCQDIIINTNDYMDRLFGKEISNLMDPHLVNRSKVMGRIHSQSIRVMPEDNVKMQIKRFNRSSMGSQVQKKNDKSQQISVVMEPQNLDEPRNPQLVSEYFEDCFKHMLLYQEKNHKLKNYMSSQIQVNQKMRGILFDWLIELHYKFKMFPQTLYLTATITDMYISKKGATKQNLQLIGTSALYIAAKYEETYQVPDLDDLVHFAAKAFSRQQIIKMEADIINVLDFNLIVQTSFRFFEPLSKVCKMQDKNFHLAQYVLELAILDVKFLEYKPSVLASSAIYLINKIRKRPESWPVNLEKITGYEQCNLKNCARQLCHLLEKADQLPNTKSLKRKFSSTQYNQVTRIKLQRKKQ